MIGWGGGASHGRDFGMIAGAPAPVPEPAQGVGRAPDRRRLPALPSATPGSGTPPGSTWSTTRAPTTGRSTSTSAWPRWSRRTFARPSARSRPGVRGAGDPGRRRDFEPYREFVLHGVTGYLVHDHEWRRYLPELANDEAMRAEMGAKAREVARGWTIQARLRSLWRDARLLHGIRILVQKTGPRTTATPGRGPAARSTFPTTRAGRCAPRATPSRSTTCEGLETSDEAPAAKSAKQPSSPGSRAAHGRGLLRVPAG